MPHLQPTHLLEINHAYMSDFTARVAPNEHTASPMAAPATDTNNLLEVKQRVIEGYEKGVEILCGMLDANENKAACEKLRRFANTVKIGIEKDFSPEVRESYLTHVHWDFDLICTLAKNDGLPKDSRQQEVLQLVKALDVCAPGIAQHIETTARQLKTLKIGVPQKFVNTLTSLIEHRILEFMHRSKLRYMVENEIHYVAAFFNPVAPHFGLHQRKDVLMPTIDAARLRHCAQSIYSTITIDHVISHMAEDCLTRIHNFYAPSHPNVKSTSFNLEIFSKLYEQFRDSLKPGLEPIFGPIDYEDVFYFIHDENKNEERYKLVSDATLIARSIARNLRSTKHAESVLNSFKAAYVIGEKGHELKLKRLGEHLVYVKSSLETPVRCSLAQFVWENHEKGWGLLKQIKDKAANSDLAKQIQNDYWQKLPDFFVRKMVAAPTQQDAVAIIRRATSLLKSSVAAKTVLTHQNLHRLSG